MQLKQQQSPEEISLKDLIGNTKELVNYLLKRWYFIILGGILGAGAGFIYAKMQPVKYVSRLSFVVEDSKGGVGGLASLAGQFGFDLGGGGGGGVFSGDNILLF